MIFEWDAEKNKINIEKHGIDFETARFVFFDPRRLVIEDIEHSDTEDRYKVIGRLGKILVVIYTIRGEKTRIISARVGNKQERGLYNGYSDISFE
jgi:uncharacterized DUF497 family protein